MVGWYFLRYRFGGKRNEDRILPINGSISVTLDQSQLCAKTTVAASNSFKADTMWLNGEKQSVQNPRIQSVLNEIRRRARKRKHSSESNDCVLNWKVHICSENNFPTAAGLASSAAGYACLVYALSKLYKVDGDISEIARQGSGSACRSVYGGFVEWEIGTLDDGTDSIAKQIATENHWPELRLLVLVVSAKKKAIGSTSGMQTSTRTSKLLEYRAKQLVPDRLQEMRKAILEKDFCTFADLTMKDSNEMHACCLDTYPPISYMNDTSREIQRLVHHINSKKNPPIVAYTYDAGPNACLYLLEENVPLVLSLVKYCYMSSGTNSSEFVRGLSTEETKNEELNDWAKELPFDQSPGSVEYVIHTKVGSGPQILTEDKASLLNSKGLPISLK